MSLRKALLSFIFILFINPLHAQNTPTPPPETSQFDFWVGEWIAEWETPEGEKQYGSNSIAKILDGFVIEENFNGNPAMPFLGKSHSVYSVAKRKWLQTWVDNNGGYLDFEGEFENDKMILSRSFTSPKGSKIHQRMIFYNISENEFDWNWELSTDDGKTFNLSWKIHYSRKK